jgi:predicted urease superfamily metal-dependent hydrolase
MPLSPEVAYIDDYVKKGVFVAPWTVFTRAIELGSSSFLYDYSSFVQQKAVRQSQR